MIRTILCLCLFLLSCSRGLSQAPPWQWAKDANSPAPEQAWDVSCDKSTGDVYVGGSFNGNLSAFYGASFSSVSGPMDAFVAKYSSTGTVLWAIKISGPDAEEVKSVATDPYGNIYVTGDFKNTVDFDPSAATYTLSTFGGAANQSGFLAKYNSSGALLWAVRFGNTQPSEGLRVFADSNFVYLTGDYTSSATFYSTNAATKTTAAGQQQLNTFGAKYNAAGVVQWVVSAGSVKDDIGYNIIADNNNVYMIGTNQHDMSVYNASGSQVATVQINGPNKTDAYILAFQQSGAFLWASNVASSDDDFGSGLTQDANNIYVSGSIKNTASFPYPSPVFTKNCLGGLDIFLAKLSKSTGTFQWVSSQTGNAGNNEVGYELDMSLNNTIIMSGYFDNTMNFSTYGGPTLNTSGNEDIFVSAFDNAGNYKWAVKAGANGKDEPYGLSTDTAGGIFIAGEHAQATVFGSITITNGAGPNIFVAKMGCNPVSNNTATASQTICAGNAPSSLSGSVPTGGSSPYAYTWQQSPNGSSWSNATGTYTNQNYSPPPLGSSMYYRRIAASANGCGISSTSSTLQVSVDAHPTTANAGSDQTICATSATMAANTPATGTGAWSLLSGSGSIVSSSSPVTGINALGAGNDKFIWTISNGVCPASKDTVTITRYAPPTTANAGSNQALCSATSTLNANSPAIGTGSWTVIAGTATVTTVSSPTSAVGSLSTGTNTLVWTISNGVCPASSSTVTIVRDAMPTTANAGSNQTICAASSTLNANAPTTGSGLWSVIAGTGTVAATSSPTTGIGNLAVGTNKFVWTISNGTCPASSSTVTVTRDAIPTTANAGTNQVLCSATSTLNANTPSIGTGNWTVTGGTGTVTAVSSPSSAVGSLSTGTNTFVWTITNGVCPASSSTVTITRDALPTTANAGSSQAICAASSTLNANVPTTGSGLWSVIAGTGTVAATSSPTTGIGNLAVGTNKFVWTISNGTCPASSSTVTVTRDALPTTANAGSDQTLCSSNATFSANAPSTGSGTWSVLAGSGSVVTAGSPTSAVNSLSTGVNKFIWTISNGTCPASKDTVNIMRDALPTTANAGNDQTLCSSTATFSANAPSTGSGTWSVLAGSGSVVTAGSPTSAVNGLSTGVNKFIWTISNGTCPASKDTVNITLDALPTTANAGSDQTLCSSTATFSANAPSTGTGAWSVLAGSGSVVTAGSPTSAVNSLSTGVNKFIWTISNGTCPASKDTVVITRDALPTTANAGIDQTLCSAGATLNANTATIGTGLWTVAAGTATVATTGAPSSSVGNLAVGVNKFVWTISNGSCPDSRDTVVISRDALPTTANAGTSQTLCAQSCTLAANTPTVGSASWSVLSGGATVSAPSSPASVANNLGVGANAFVWTITNGVCPASSSTVTITRDALPTTANAGSDQVLCSGTSTLNANAATTGTGSWTVIAGTGTVTASGSATTPVANLSTGANQFVWTISNGTCPASYDTVAITRDIPPSIASAGSNQTLCAQSCTLAANTPTVGSASWSVLSGGGTIANNNMPGSSVNNLGPGANTFVWTISNGTCPDSKDTVVIARDLQPTPALAGADQTICGPASTFNANAPSVGTGSWALISGSGTATSPSSASSPVTGLGTGTNIFTWTISNGSCLPSSDTIKIMSDALPSMAVAGTDQAICAPNGSVTANTPSTGTGLWTVVSGTGIIASPGLANTAVTGLSAGNNVFAWAISNGICPVSSDTVIIRRDLQPTTALAGNDQAICATGTTLDGNTPVTGTGAWSIVSGSGSFNNSSAPQAQVSGLLPGNTVFAWTISNGVCQASQDTVIVHADASPGTANAGSDQGVCSNATALSAIPPLAGSGTWSLVSGSGSLVNPGSASSAVNALGIGTSVFRWTVSNGVCPSSYDDVSVKRDSMPSQAQAGPDQDLKIPAGHLSAIAPTVGSGSWSLVSGSGQVDNPLDPATAFHGLAVGSNIFEWTVSNGVCPASKDEVIVYLEPFKIPNAFSPNGDNINDMFVVPGMDYYDGVKFTVFNRWGGEVYSNDNYKNDWGGTNKSNELLAEDTYYYILDVGPQMTYSGYVIIKRNK